MAYILAVLVVLLKVFACTLATVAALVILFSSLPVRVRVSGSVSAAGLLEGVLDDDATVKVEIAGASPSGEDAGEEDVVPVAVDYGVDASVLAGAVGFSMHAGGAPEVVLLGVRLLPRRKAAPSGEPNPKTRTLAKKQAKERIKGQTKRKTANKGARVPVSRLKQFLAPRVRARTFGAVRALWRAVHFQGTLDVECGFPDPGSTAMVLASYWALGGPPRFGGATFRPNFCGEVLDVNVSGESRLVPVEIGWIAVRYLLSREIRPLWRKARNGRTGGAGTNRRVGAVSA